MVKSTALVGIGIFVRVTRDYLRASRRGDRCGFNP
jgi:hypothetical protein